MPDGIVFYLTKVDPKSSTLYEKSSTLPEILNPQPSPENLNPQVSPSSETLNPSPQSQPSTPNPKPQTLSHTASTLNPQPLP